MNWERAKTILIFIMAILNIGLFAMNTSKSNIYKISAEQKSALNLMLEKNNINLLAKIPEEFYPQSSIWLSQREWSSDYIQQAFFKSSKDIKRTTELNKTIFKTDSISVTIDATMISYEKLIMAEYDEVLAKGDAIIIADEFIERLGGEFDGFSKDSIIIEGANFTLIYYEEYKGKSIYSNYVKIIVSGSEVIRADIEKYNIEGVSGLEKNIAAPDEILLTFVSSLGEDEVLIKEKEYVITKIDLGYSINNSSELSFGRIVAMPYYRVFLQNNPNPYLINAYLNQLDRDW